MALDEYLTPAGPSAVADAQREKDMTQSLAYQHFLRAKQFIKQKNLLLAIREFERALEIHPEDPMVRRLLLKTREAHTRFGQKPAAPGVPAPVTPSPSAGRAPVPRPTAAPRAAAASAYSHPPIPGPIARAPAAPVQAPRAAAASHAAAPVAPRPVVAPPVRTSAPTVAEAAGKRSAAPGASRKTGTVAPQTGKFLEAYSKVPSMSLALLVEAETDDRAKELLVSLLILLGLFAFTTLLFV